MSKSFRILLSLSACLFAVLSFACGGAEQPTANNSAASNTATQTAPAGANSAPETNTPAPANSQTSAPQPNTETPGKPKAVAIKAKDGSTAAGREFKLEIDVTSSEELGAIIFTLDFNPSVFKYLSSAKTTAAPESAVLTVNDQQTSNGKLGVLLDTTTAFEKGKRTVMTVTFQVADGAAAGEYPFTFSSKPAIQSVSTIKADLVEAAYLPGVVRVTAGR